MNREGITIRRAVPQDLPYVYEICLKTGDDGGDASALFYDAFMLGHYYAAPYIVFQDSISFMVDYHYRPQGYIIAVPDTAAFEQWMEEQWLPPLREQYARPFPPELIRSEREGRLIEQIHQSKVPAETAARPWLNDYPAHLHVDLLPAVQGKGLGRVLMDRLFEELAGRGVPGLHLGVSANNTGAAAFYRKTGFTVLQAEEWGFVMGKQCGTV